MTGPRLAETVVQSRRDMNLDSEYYGTMVLWKVTGLEGNKQRQLDWQKLEVIPDP